ncbi:MAG: hypothetical protein Q9219_003345 [cf. Caloplaca sp. 3 TL-2023]
MASREMHGLRTAKSAEKEGSRSRIPKMSLSRKSSVTSATSNVSKPSSSSISWFSRNKHKQAPAPPPAVPTLKDSTTMKKTAKPSDETFSRSAISSRRRQAAPTESTSDIPTAKASDHSRVFDMESPRQNVLRRKPSSIDQRSRYAHTASSITSDERMNSRLQDTVSSPDTSKTQAYGSVFGVALPTISASSSNLPTRGVEPSDQATSSSRMAAYNAYRAPKTPTPQLLPPLAPSFANSSGSSTRRSDSPGSFSRTSTPTSISSYSPGIPATSKSPLRLGQASPAHSRPPVTRNWPVNGSKQELGVDEKGRSLSVVQETTTSSSSSDTVRGRENSASSHQGHLSPLIPTLYEFARQDETERRNLSPLSTQQYPASRDTGTRSRGFDSVHEPSHDSFTHVVQSATQHAAKTPPSRPSREGTPQLEYAVIPSPVIRSNLSRLETTGHKRRQSWGKPISSSPYESHRPSTSQSSQDMSVSRSASKSRLPSPSPASVGPSRTWPTNSTRSGPTLRSDTRERTVGDSRGLSPTAARGTRSRFGLFSRRTSPVRTGTAESSDKSSKKGPAAGTGHEGYGKYARRGRSGSRSTSVSRGGSTSSNATASSTARTSGTRQSSFTGREEPEIDDFLRDRLSPVIISGGMVSNDPNGDAELYRTTSGASSVSLMSSDDSSTRGPNPSSQQRTKNLGGSTMAINSTTSSRRDSGNLSREKAKSAKTSDTEDRAPPFDHTLASQRSLHQSCVLKGNENPTRPRAAPVNTRVAVPLPASSSRYGVHSSALSSNSSLFLADDISEGREGNWLKSKKTEKPPKSPSKWNFLQRANGAHKKPSSRRPSQDDERPQEVPVAITRLPETRSVAHYAMIDSSGQEYDDGEGLIPSLKDIDLPAVSGSVPTLSHRQEAWRRQEHKQSMLLPSPPTMPAEFTNTQKSPPSKTLIRQPASASRILVENSKPKEPRLQRIGRIPRVGSERDRQHKPPAQSFSRPFSRGNAIKEPQISGSGTKPQIYNPGRPALGLQTEVIPSNPCGGQDSAGPASAPARPQAHTYGGLGEDFLAFPQRYNSGLSGSSSSGTMSFALAATNDQRPENLPHEDDVWNEYDDFLDVVESPAPIPSNPFERGNQGGDMSKSRMTPAPLRVRKDSAASSTHSASASVAQERLPTTAAPTSPLPSPPSRLTLLTPNLASSPLSFSEFIAGYGDRNRGSGVSNRQSSVSGSHYSQASMQYTPSEAEQKRHTQVMAEKTRNSSGSQSNLRFSALMTSRWLSFGRVLFSPAHDEIQSAKQDRILVLDGLGNDDWSFYCALTYPDATIYNLSSFKRMGTASARRRELGMVQSPPNHRQIFHAGMAAPFPFPKGYFSAAVFRFPTAMTESAYYNAVSECKRVLRPGGYLEISILELDMVNMGNRARRAVRALKVRMQATQSDVSLQPLSDSIQKMLGRRGFENLSRCMVTVPVAGGIVSSSSSDSHSSSRARGGSVVVDEEVDFGEMLKDPTPRGDESITKMVSRVGRWWYSRCYEADGVLGDNDVEGRSSEQQQSIWADRALLRECEKRETGLKLLICYAQKPLRVKRRTISL